MRKRFSNVEIRKINEGEKRPLFTRAASYTNLRNERKDKKKYLKNMVKFI